MRFLDLVLPLVALLGHLGLWVAMLNRAHSIGIPRPLVNLSTVTTLVMLPLGPCAVLVGLWKGYLPSTTSGWLHGKCPWISGYFILCWIVAVIVVLGWLRRVFWESRTRLLLANHSTDFDIAARLGKRPVARFLGTTMDWIPWNQSLRVRLQEKSLEIPRLDARLAGLSILHLSDFHWTGRLTIDFHAEVARLGAAPVPDLIVLTGDFLDSVACIEWVPKVFEAIASEAWNLFRRSEIMMSALGELAATAQCGWRKSARSISAVVGFRSRSTVRPSCSPEKSCPGSRRRRICRACPREIAGQRPLPESFSPTRPTNGAGPRSAISTCCWPGTRMADKPACRSSGRSFAPAATA